jgi:uncharacterized protein
LDEGRKQELSSSWTAADMVRKPIAIFVAMAFAIVFVPVVDTATAQERVQRSPSILEFFGLVKPRPQKVAPPAKKRVAKRATTRVVKRKKSKSANPSVVRGGEPSVIGELPAAPVVKLESAKPVLVIGDFMAGGLAEGLTEAFSDTAGITILEKWNGSSGFVRNDYYDWPASLPALLSETKPAVVVIMMGTNDRQQMKVADNREAIGTPAWTGEYEKRVAAFAAALKTSGVPAIWVGQPAFRSTQMSTSMTSFNDIYRKNVESVGGVFVDIWDGFVDEAGMFQQTGPDMNGLPARLRGGDGISFARAGKRKAAFYVEKPLRQLLGDAAAPALVSLPSPSSTGFIGPMRPAPVVITRTDPINLNDPELDGSTELLGSDPRPSTSGLKKSTPAIDKFAPGATRPKSGRVDDFTWNEPDLENIDKAETAAPDSTGATLSLTSARRSIPSGTHPPTAPPDALRGSPTRRATGRDACRQRQTACRRWCGNPAHWPSHCRARRA